MKKQRVVRNDQNLSCRDIIVGFLHRSILGPLLFLININNLSDGLESNLKLFADDTLLFATVHNINKARNELSNELTKSTKWVHQCKMSFNPDISNKAH